jgi:hypothetical protein
MVDVQQCLACGAKNGPDANVCWLCNRDLKVVADIDARLGKESSPLSSSQGKWMLVVAVASIVTAGLSYMASFAIHPWWGFAAAIVSLLLGVAGLVRAGPANVSGGWLSICVILLAVGGISYSMLIIAIGNVFPGP